MIKYPQNLNQWDTIGITALSDSAKFEKIDYAIENLAHLGYKIKETNNVRYKSCKLVSSSPDIRIKEFISLWKDTNVKVIIAARGGDFSMEMLPLLYENIDFFIENEPKWLQGYSDISLISYFLTTKCNIATINSSNINTYAMTPLPYSLLIPLYIESGKMDKEIVQESFQKYQIEEIQNNPKAEFNFTENVKYINLKSNYNCSFSGRMLGGTIDTISILLGTKYDNTLNFCKQYNEGIIWYFDNYGYNVADLYRVLWQCRQAGWFDNARGFLFGRTYSKEKIKDFTYEDALKKSLGDLNVPIIYDVDIGHIYPQLTIVNGSYAIFEYNSSGSKLTQKLDV
ncbi:MAG: LD-carboxypeptidase [Clostridia bacterium]